MMTSSWKFTSEIKGVFQMVTNDDERGKNAKNLMTSYVNKVICERPLTSEAVKILILILKILPIEFGRKFRIK